MIAAVDEFILYDDMQYTRRDWRNRNPIKTHQGVQWLTVPVLVNGKYHQKIRETEIDGTDWAAVRWFGLVGQIGDVVKLQPGLSYAAFEVGFFTQFTSIGRMLSKAVCGRCSLQN